MDDQRVFRKDRSYMLHVLRNPYGWSEELVREIRLMAANELERLYKIESALKQIKEDLEDAVK